MLNYEYFFNGIMNIYFELRRNNINNYFISFSAYSDEVISLGIFNEKDKMIGSIDFFRVDSYKEMQDKIKYVEELIK